MTARFPFSVKIRRLSRFFYDLNKRNDMIAWCDERLGKDGGQWCWEGGAEGYREFIFKSEVVAVEFKLRFG